MSFGIAACGTSSVGGGVGVGVVLESASFLSSSSCVVDASRIGDTSFRDSALWCKFASEIFGGVGVVKSSSLTCRGWR